MRHLATLCIMHQRTKPKKNKKDWRRKKNSKRINSGGETDVVKPLSSRGRLFADPGHGQELCIQAALGCRVKMTWWPCGAGGSCQRPKGPELSEQKAIQK